MEDVTNMLSRMKTLLVDVSVEKSLPDASRIKLKDCMSILETFSKFLNSNLKKEGHNSNKLLKPLHSGLSGSTECLHGKKGDISKSRSTPDLANMDLSDYVIPLQSVEQNSQPQTERPKNSKMLDKKRRETKKRIDILRWLKKAIVDKGEDKATVIGDIYRIEAPDNHVKLWCLLYDRQLHCYRKVTDTTPETVIPLDNCIAVPSAVVSSQKYAFDIKKEGVKLVTFAAWSSNERARWIEIVKSKRGKFLMAEIHDESGKEAAEFGTSEEDNDDSYEYVDLDANNNCRKKFTTGGEYALPMSEDEIDDDGYISVLALESEIDRRKTCRINKEHNPNITTKSGIEHLIQKDTPPFMSTLPGVRSGPGKGRSPAPFPKLAVRHHQPAIYVNSDRVSGDESDTVDESGYEDMSGNPQLKTVEKESLSRQFADNEEHSREKQEILHCQLTASSWLSDSPPSQARFAHRQECRKGASGAWRPETNDKHQFLEMDLGDIRTVGAIAIKGRPDFEEKGGEFVKSFTIHYSNDRETWIPYKSHGKLKIFQGSSNASQECTKYLKTKTTAQYIRIYPQSWHNHIALRVALYHENVKSKGGKKKADKSNPTSPTDNPADLPASMESRIKLKEKLLSKEKREQIAKLELLTKHMEQAKGQLIVGNSSGQLKREAIKAEHDYLVANLEQVKAKQRLIDIETEIKDLRLFEEKYGGE